MQDGVAMRSEWIVRNAEGSVWACGVAVSRFWAPVLFFAGHPGYSVYSKINDSFVLNSASVGL
jgi:hypothetical protein